MPKKIYNNWLGGLTSYSLNIGKEGSYAEARDVDPHRKPGFIVPGWAESNKTSSSGGVLAGLISSAVVDPDSTDFYAISATKVYKLTNAGTSFVNDANWPHAVPTAEDDRVDKEVFFYNVGNTSYLFYIMDTDIGRCDVSGPTFIDDYLTNASYLNASALSDAPHPTIEWKTYRWIGDGRYLHKFDGQDGTYGSWDSGTNYPLDLGEGWEITTLFPTRNYIGICAWYKHSPGPTYKTRARVFFWDGVSADYNYSIPIEDNKIISALNDNGRVYLVTEGRELGSVLRRLTEAGDIPLRHLKTFVSGAVTSFSNSQTVTNYRNTIDIFQNRVLIGATSTTRNMIFAFGSPDVTFPEALIQPYSCSDDPSSGGAIGFVGHLMKGSIYVSAYDGTNYYWMRFTGSYSSNALLKERYTETGQKIRINYVKFYFQPLVSGDDVTVSLETDYGTSHSLGTITYSTDGAITSKRFNKIITCHAFRPVIQWSSGGTAFSRIVIDYDFISDVG